MKRLLYAIMVLLVASSVSYAQQSAREQLKQDSSVRAEGLSDEELDKIVDEIQRLEKIQAAEEAKERARVRMEQLLEEEPQLRSGIRSENRPNQ